MQGLQLTIADARGRLERATGQFLTWRGCVVPAGSDRESAGAGSPPGRLVPRCAAGPIRPGRRCTRGSAPAGRASGVNKSTLASAGPGRRWPLPAPGGRPGRGPCMHHRARRRPVHVPTDGPGVPLPARGKWLFGTRADVIDHYGAYRPARYGAIPAREQHSGRPLMHGKYPRPGCRFSLLYAEAGNWPRFPQGGVPCWSSARVMRQANWCYG